MRISEIILEGKRIPRKKGQKRKSKKHSDLYTDEDPKGTIHGLGFKDEATARSSVSKIRKSGRSHAHKIQAAVAMEQRARAAGKTGPAAVYRKYINAMKKKTKAKNETKEAPAGTYFTKTGNLVKGRLTKDAKARGARETDPKHKMRSQVPPVTQSNENFADGKKKGRKGLSKKVGVSQKMSISQLQKIAKNSTGERRRMAQWNLNMKRGRKKK